MKPFHSFALLAAIAAVGQAFAVDATTTPVGYESVAIASGFNYFGVRMHEPTLAAGTVTAVTASSVSDSAANFGTLLTGGASTTYILEFENTSGVIQEITGASASGSTINLTDDITSKVAVGAQYRIRKASTIASIFGSTNSAGLTPGFSGPGGADIVYVPGAGGSLTQYFYDDDNGTWANAQTNTPVTATSVPLVYTDGFIIFANGAVSVTVSGELKTKEVSEAVLSGFNYLGTTYPVGATLATAFSANIGTIHPGFSGPGGADIVYVPTGGSFVQYFYDDDNGTWSNAATNTPVDATTISLTTAVIYFNAGGAINLKSNAPASYATL